MLAKLWRQVRSQEERWLFLQAPGTADFEGEIFSCLSELFPRPRVHSPLIDEQTLRNRETLEKFALLRSSLPLQRLHQQFPGWNVLLYLRDPISTVVRLYLSQPEPKPEFRSWLGSKEKPGYPTDFFTRMLSQHSLPEGPSHLDQAEKLLRDFPGQLLVHPEAQRCYEVLRRAFGGLSLSVPAQLQTQEPAVLLEPSVRELILEQNPLDRALYTMALEYFRLTSNRQEQSAEWTAGRDLDVKGCHDLEVFRDGKAFFWTGAQEEAVLSLPIRLFPDSQVSLALETVTTLGPSIFDNLQVKLGGQLVSRVRPFRHDDLVWRGCATVGESPALFGETTELSLSSPTVQAAGSDSRRLGLALHKVSLQFSGHLRSQDKPVQALGPLLAALSRSRPQNSSDRSLRYHQLLETILDQLWENQALQDERSKVLRGQVERLREEWEKVLESTLLTDNSRYLLHEVRERLGQLEELLDPYVDV